MKYQSKPVIVEAEQFVGGLKALKLRGVCAKPKCNMGGPHVHTIHNNQAVLLEVGDYILPEPDGVHFYPVKPDIFQAKYERIENAPLPNGYSICERSVMTVTFGFIDAFHRFENSAVAVCGQRYCGNVVLPREFTERPGLPFHCEKCEASLPPL